MKHCVAGLLVATLFFSGCAHYKARLDDTGVYKERAQTLEKGNVRVSATALSGKESKYTFGVDLEKKGILPIWIEVENKDPELSFFFLERPVDPEYYTAGEAAYMSEFRPGYRIQKILPPFLDWITAIFRPFGKLFSGSANEELQREFKRSALNYGWIASGEARSGFVFVPSTMGTKQIVIDLYGSDYKVKDDGTLLEFEFYVQVPGIKQDYLTKDFQKIVNSGKIIDIEDEDILRETLENLPCCVTNKKATKNGDPLNLVVIGEPEEVLASFTVARWDETEEVYLGSIWKMMKSFSFKKKYRYSPVSPLYFFGRSHDIAFQKARSTINERMHLRLWFSPMRFRGTPVWVGSVSRDIGVRFTNKTWNLMTHKIDPDIDESALYTLFDLIYRRRVEKFGIFEGIPPSTPENPSLNLTNDTYYTKGRRVVLLLSHTEHLEFPGKIAGAIP